MTASKQQSAPGENPSLDSTRSKAPGVLPAFGGRRRLWSACRAAGLLLLLGGLAAEADLQHSVPPPPGGGLQSGALLGSSVAVDGGLTVAGAPSDDFSALEAGVVKVFNSTTGALLRVIQNPTPGVSDNFGWAVAISGTRVVVGAPLDDTGGSNAGSAYVYDLASATPNVPMFTLNNPGPGAEDRFGWSVAISGSRVVVGAHQDSTGADQAGIAYVFDLASGTPTVPVFTLTKPSPAMHDYFGHSVAISGLRVVVGSYGESTGAVAAGSAYVYDLGSGNPTVPTATLNNPSPESNDYFGHAVAVSGARVVVGAFSDNTGATDAGSAYVYDFTSGPPSGPWATLHNPTPAASDQFARAVAISGTRVVVGAYLDDTGASGAGSAYVYDLGTGAPTIPVATLNNPSPAASDFFGGAVAISGPQVVIGASTDDPGAGNAGSAYVYDVSGGPPAAPIAVLNNPGPSVGDRFGQAVAISGTRMVIGAYSDGTAAAAAGSAYVYDLAGPTPTVPVFTLNNPSPAVNDYFGFAVSISGARVVIGASRDDTGANDAGSAYVYDLAGGTPTVPVATLNNPSPTANDFFGSSVGISGTRVVVGAYLDDAGTTDAGRAYVYDLTSGTPTVPGFTLNNPSPALNDYFGSSVAISGSRVVVGSPQNDTGANNDGSAYVYDLASPAPTLPVTTLHNPGPGADDFFGASVAISGTRVVVGAAQDDTGAINAGSAYAYHLAGGNPTVPVATLNNPGPGAGEAFGQAVAISGTRVVVGAHLDGTGALGAGIAYGYDLASAPPTVPVDILYHPGPSGGDNFGAAVAVDGDSAAIGAPLVDLGGADKGYAYVFGLTDLVTLPPVLTTPPSLSATRSPLAVSYFLPEAAANGTVKLTFTGDVTCLLNLTNPQGTAGEHSFTFNLANPTASPEIASGSVIPDGIYTVTVSYQDALGNPAAAASSTNVVIDTTGPTGGSLALLPFTTVAPGAAMTVDFSGWNDSRLPLSYALLLDEVLVSPAGPAASRSLTAPATLGLHSVKGRITDGLGNVTEIPRTFTVVTPQEAWRFAYFSTTTDGGLAANSADPDGDGLLNLFEYLAGLVPTDPLSRFDLRIAAVPGQPGQRAIIFRPVLAGRTYQVQSKASLGDSAWLPLTSFTTSNNGAERTVIDFAPGPDRKYYRVQVSLP